MLVNTFIRELRRTESNPRLFVCRHKEQARKVGVHFMCWQVWDQNPATGEPYPVHAICTAEGLPRDPSDIDFALIAMARMDNPYQTRKSWKKSAAGRTLRQEEAELDRKTREWRDYLHHEGFRDAERRLGHHKVFGVEKLDARPNRRQRRAAQAQRPGR